MTKYVPSKRGSFSASCGGLIMFDWQNWQHKPKSSHFGFLLKKVPEWSDPEVSGSHDKSWSNSPNAEESHFSPAAYGALSKQIVNPTTIRRLRQLNTRDETDRTGGILGKSPWTNWFWTACGENEDPPSTVDLRGDEEGGEVMVIGDSCVIPNHHTAFPFKSLTMGCFLYAGLKLLTTADYEL